MQLGTSKERTTHPSIQPACTNPPCMAVRADPRPFLQKDSPPSHGIEGPNARRGAGKCNLRVILELGVIRRRRTRAAPFSSIDDSARFHRTNTLRSERLSDGDGRAYRKGTDGCSQKALGVAQSEKVRRHVVVGQTRKEHGASRRFAEAFQSVRFDRAIGKRREGGGIPPRLERVELAQRPSKRSIVYWLLRSTPSYPVRPWFWHRSHGLWSRPFQPAVEPSTFGLRVCAATAAAGSGADWRR